MAVAKFTTKKWKRPTQWSREGMPKSVFLDPVHRKYPVKKTAHGPYYVHALVAAAHFAKMYKDTAVYNKAKRLLDEYAKSQKRGKRR